MWIRFEGSMIEGVLLFGTIYAAFAGAMLGIASWMH